MMLESSRESGRRLISGIADYAQHFGPWHFHWEPKGSRFMEPLPKNMRFDGVIARYEEEAQPYIDAGIPVVAFGHNQSPATDMCCEKDDDYGLAKIVVNHFLQRGFKQFAFCGYPELSWSVNRGAGFAAVVEEAGFSVEIFMKSHEQDGKDSEEAITCWLASLPRPVALLAANDDMGRLVVRLCRDAGLRVPNDCAVVGVDNDPVICGMSYPPLSSVKIDQHLTGYDAAAMLDKMMKGEVVVNRRIPSATVGELIVRQSSDIFKVEDAAVAKALRFIQTNANRPLSVDEIALSSGVHRRSLQRRFHDHLSSTIDQYYRTARAEYVAKLIRESRLSLEEIAEQCGFSEASHLSRFFTSVRGETPSAYRKRTPIVR